MLLAPLRTCSTAMSFSPSQASRSSPKRPRLSLQIKTPDVPRTLGKSATALKSDIDPTSPTAFNTLSNAYAVAIENSSPMVSKPLPNQLTTSTATKQTPLRLETAVSSSDGYFHPSQRTQTPGPISTAYPDTPGTAPAETPKLGQPFTFTPPQSAGLEESVPRVFTFAAQTPEKAAFMSPRTPRRRATFSGSGQAVPYTHPRTLRSILRNSPLPPPSTITPTTPRTSHRLKNRTTKRVGYNNPLTQTITTNKYTTSHIELLTEEDDHGDMMNGAKSEVTTLDVAMAYTGDETRDGGQTPGPFEEMRRRMAGLEAESEPESAGLKRRKTKEKKRKWVWTIGAEDGDEADEIVGTPRTAVHEDDTPATAIWRGSSVSSDSTLESIDERPSTSQSL